MKRVLIVVVLIIAAAILGLWRSQGGVRAGLSRIAQSARDNSPDAANDEIRKTLELRAGALIRVEGINGKVDIQTSDTRTAEVYVRRTGKDAESLRRRAMTVEQTGDGLVVRSKQNHTGFWDHLFGSDPKEEITIKAPRQIALTLKGINGRVNAGDIDGSLEVKGINGRVEVGSANNSADISGVNGSISVGLRQLGDRGARVSGVNGGVELKLSYGLNADLTARGMNGSVRSEISDVVIDRENSWSRYSARIGKGGPPIEISGINGNVRLTRGEGNTGSSNVTEKKAPTEVVQKASAVTAGKRE